MRSLGAALLCLIVLYILHVEELWVYLMAGIACAWLVKDD